MAVVSMKSKDEARYSPAEWQARVDLAAAHRLCVMNGFHEGIFNHLTLTVPGKPGRYYQIPFGLHWAEVTASCFMEVSFDGERLSGEGESSSPATASTRRSTATSSAPPPCSTPTCPGRARCRGWRTRAFCRSARP